MAKGVEDTAFYCFNRFVAIKEVGGNPGCFGASVEDFHRDCRRRQDRWPGGMLATSTHDTKRSEDARALEPAFGNPGSLAPDRVPLVGHERAPSLQRPP
jgi:maltooligosyltrehalose synthase